MSNLRSLLKGLMIISLSAWLSACGGGGGGGSTGFFESNPITINNVEGKREISWCPYAIRYNVIAADLNLDGVNDLISVVRCFRQTYSEGWYTNPHDRDTPAAWNIWTSRSNGSFVSSTSAIVGTSYVDVSDQMTGGFVGGIQQVDINKDGYLDIVYHVNRDDSRAVDNDGLINPDAYYTWRSQQSVLMSKGNGTYEVQYIGDPFFAGLKTLIPNQIDTYDFVVLGGAGGWLAYRYEGGIWIDVSAEWSTKSNWTSISERSSYWNLIDYSLPMSALDVADNPTHLVQHGFALSDDLAPNGMEYLAIALYDITSTGFDLAGTWQSDNEPLPFRNQCSNCPGGWQEGRANYWDGQITFDMVWEDFHVVRLYKDEPPVLIAHALGKSIHGSHRNDPLDPVKIYGSDESLAKSRRYVPAQIFQVFDISGGTLVPSDDNILPEKVMREPGYTFEFRDINNDQYDDLIVISLSTESPALWLNDRNGQFIRVDSSVYPPGNIGEGDINLGDETLFFGASGALKDFNGDGLLDLVKWHKGFDGFEQSWHPVGYATTAKWQTGNIEIFFAKKALNVSDVGMSLNEIIDLEQSQ